MSARPAETSGTRPREAPRTSGASHPRAAQVAAASPPGLETRLLFIPARANRVPSREAAEQARLDEAKRRADWVARLRERHRRIQEGEEALRLKREQAQAAAEAKLREAAAQQRRREEEARK